MHPEVNLNGLNFEKVDLEKLSDLVGGKNDFYAQDAFSAQHFQHHPQQDHQEEDSRNSAS